MQRSFASEIDSKLCGKLGLIGALRDAHAGIIARLEHEFAESCAMTLPDFDVLHALVTADRCRLRMSDLAETARMSQSGLSRRIDALALRGDARRETCEVDGRGVLAVLTASGAQRIGDAVVVYHRAERTFRDETVTWEEAPAFERVLLRVTDPRQP